MTLKNARIDRSKSYPRIRIDTGGNRDSQKVVAPQLENSQAPGPTRCPTTSPPSLDYSPFPRVEVVHSAVILLSLLHSGTILLNRFNVICPVQSFPQKYSPSHLPQISPRNPAISSPTRGVSRSSRTLGWDAVDAAAPGVKRDGRAGRQDL